MNVMC